ncbi:MAG: HlyD family efflux transporter periplasmic adaptor subunit [Pseudomonadota bacterium]
MLKTDAVPTDKAEGPKNDSASVTRLENASRVHGSPSDARTGDAEVARSRTPLQWIGFGLLTAFKVVLPVVVLAAAYAGAQYLRDTRPSPPAPNVVEARAPIRTVVAKVQTVRPKLRLYGVAVAGRQVEMRSLVAGRVVETGEGLKDGAVVPAGGLLLRIDPFDYRSDIKETEAQLAEARAKLSEFEAALSVEVSNLAFAREQLKLAIADLERAEALSKRGNLAERSLDDRRLIVSQRRQAVRRDENNVKVQQARIDQQKAQIARLENTLARNRQRLTETRLVSPFEAYVTDVGAQVGRMLVANDRVATLIDRNWIDVSFTLTDRQYGRLLSERTSLVGRTVDVRWEIGREPIRYTAAVERVAARVSSNSGGVDVFARIKDPTVGVPLRPGAFMRVSLDDTKFEDVIRVPASALYDGRLVYVVVDGRLVEQQVTPVGVDDAYVLLKGAIEPGARIMVTRLAAPGPGLAVKEL